MADKFNSGDPLFKLPTLRAAFVNDLVDLLAWAKLNGFGGRPSPAEAFSTPTDIVKVRNLVGGDCELGDVVQLGDELLDDKDKRYPWFEGNAVDDPAERRWAILLQPIKTGEMGMAIVSGVCLANVTVGSEDDTHATPASSSASLTSGTSGPIEILSPVESTGPQLLWCRLGGGGGGGGVTSERYRVLAMEGDNPGPGAYVDCVKLTGDLGSEVDSEDTSDDDFEPTQIWNPGPGIYFEDEVIAATTVANGKLAIAPRKLFHIVKIPAAGTIPKGSTGPARIFSVTDTDSGVDITVYALLSTLTAETKVKVEHDGTGWAAGPGECLTE